VWEDGELVATENSHSKPAENLHQP